MTKQNNNGFETKLRHFETRKFQDMNSNAKIRMSKKMFI